MICPEPASDLRVEVFMEEDAIAPVWVGGVADVVAEAGAKALFIQGEEGGQST